jgi:aldehyde dehydrogenase (NAD+)
LANWRSTPAFPPGVLNIITAAAVPSARPSSNIRHRQGRVHGRHVDGQGHHATAAETLKHVTLELGGKSPNIVFPDADLDAAVRGATIGIFYGKGEVCAAGSRLLVDRSIKDSS